MAQFGLRAAMLYELITCIYLFIYYYLLQDEDALCNKLCTFTITQKEFMNQHW